jgi:glutaredoxin 2
MRLYLFEHCSICFRVRMAAALKRLHLQETVVLEDGSDTMTRLVGKRVVPILVKDDGQPMLESMDMVGYIDDCIRACSNFAAFRASQNRIAKAVGQDRAPKNRGSTTPREFPGRRSSPPARAPTMA